MKSKKLLVGVLSASGIAIALPAITSCACHGGNYNEPTVSSKTPKEREIGSKSTRTYFIITQSNIKEPEETKVKMVNLKVNGADAQPVAGLIRSYPDSAGNILVVFNMSIAQKQYQAGDITFDLKLTNKSANTEYVVRDFKITLSATASYVNYEGVDGGVKLTSYPDSVGAGEDLTVEFELKPGYEWLENDYDILVNDESIKDEALVVCDFNNGYIVIPQSYIPENSEIKIILKTDGKEFTVDHSGASATQHIKYTGANKVKHPANYTATIEPESAYYTFNPAKDTWTATLNDGTDLKATGKAKFDADKKTLTVDGQSIVDDLIITAEASPAQWTCKLNSKPTPVTDVKLSATPTYGKGFTATITVSDEYYTISIEKIEVKDAVTSAVRELKLNDDYTYDSKTRLITFNAKAVTGDITIYPKSTAQTFNVEVVDGEKAATPHFTFTSEQGKTATHGTPYVATVTPSENYTLTAKDIKVECPKGTTLADWTYADNTLTVSGNSIKNELTITVTPKPATYAFHTQVDSHFTSITPSSGTATYNTNLELTYKLDGGYELDESATDCAVATTPATTLKIGDGITHDKTNSKLIIDGSRIKGELYLHAWSKGQSYTATLGTTHIGISKLGTLSPTSPQYHKALTIPFVMEENYVFNETDFTASTANADPNVKIVMSGTTGRTLVNGTDFDVDVDKKTITIHENVIEGNLTISGEIQEYTVTATQTGTQFSSLPTGLTVRKNTALSDAEATLNEGYFNPIITSIKSTSSTWEETFSSSDYTLNAPISSATSKLTFTSSGAAKVIGPVTIQYAAQAGTVSFDNPQTTLCIGDTSKAYSAYSNPSGATPVITLNEGQPSGTTLNESTRKLTAGETEGTATLTARRQGASVEQAVSIVTPTLTVTGSSEILISGTTTLSYKWGDATPSSAITSTEWKSSAPSVATINSSTGEVTGVAEGETQITVEIKYGVLTNPIVSSQFKLTVSEEKTFTISGDHEFTVGDSSAHELTAKWGSQEASTASWQITTGSDLISLDTTSGSTVKVTPTSAGSTNGGYAEVTCKYTPTSNGEEQTLVWGICIASYDKLEIKTKQEFYKTCWLIGKTGITGNVVVPSYRYVDGVKYTVEGLSEEAFKGAKISSISIPTTVQGIQSNAFQNATITSIVIPDSVKSISNNAFMWDDTETTPTLQSITLPKNTLYTTIAQNLFSGQTNLSSITIPANITQIWNYSFQNCSSLTQITIPENVEIIGEFSFTGCTGLATVYIDSATIAGASASSSMLVSLLANATTVYVKSGLTVGKYITQNFPNVGTETEGYIPYSKT